MKKIYIFFFAFVSAVFYTGLGFTAENPQDNAIGHLIRNGEMLTMQRCIDIALKMQPNIAASQSAVSASQSRVGQAQANYYPQLSLSGGYSRTSPAGSRSETSSGGGGPYNQYSGSASLTQNIYDFGRTSSRVSIQELNADASRSDLKNITEQVVFNVKQAYYGVLQTQKNKEVAQEAVKQFQQHLGQAKGFYEVGVKSKFDVTKADVDLSNARLNLIRADNSLKIAIAHLNNAMGITEAPNYTIEDNLLFNKYEITLETALSKALKNRQDLQSVALRRKGLEESVKLAQKGYYPTVTGNAAYNYSGDNFPLNHGWNLGAAVTFPLFSGFLTKHEVAESIANLDIARANEESLRQNVVLDVQQAYLNLKEAENRIPAAEIVVRQATENLELANGRYAAGVGSPIEVTDAQVSYINSKTAYIQALSDYKVAQAALEKAMGVRQ
jgi:outer membrane protein TolC